MIFEPVEGSETNSENIETRLRELLFLFTDACFRTLESHKAGNEDIKPAHLNIIRQFLDDQGVDYKDALNEAKAEAMQSLISRMPDFAYFKRKHGTD